MERNVKKIQILSAYAKRYKITCKKLCQELGELCCFPKTVYENGILLPSPYYVYSCGASNVFRENGAVCILKIEYREKIHSGDMRTVTLLIIKF